jgi:hypothetical protein
MELYVALVQRLREDAAAAVTALARARGEDIAPVKSSEIDPWRRADGSWRAVVRAAGGWLAGYGGDGRPSEVEALCSLIDRAHREGEAAGSLPVLHLLEQLDSDRDALAVYRDQIGKSVLEALEALDMVGEASPFAAEMDVLRAAAAEGS